MTREPPRDEFLSAAGDAAALADPEALQWAVILGPPRCKRPRWPPPRPPRRRSTVVRPRADEP